MRYRKDYIMTKEMHREVEIPDEYFYRKMVLQIIKEIPLDELKKVFKLKKTDPESIEVESIFWTLSDFEKDKIQRLRNQGVILYEAEINII